MQLADSRKPIVDGGDLMNSLREMVKAHLKRDIHDYIQEIKTEEPKVPDALKQDNGPLEHADLVRFYRWLRIVIAPDWKWHLKHLAAEDPKMYGLEYLSAVRREYGTRLYWYDRNQFGLRWLEGGSQQRKKMKRRMRSQFRRLTEAVNEYNEALRMLGMIGGAM